MADGVTINGGKSQAEVAYTLLIAIASVEEKWTGASFKNADRKWLLDTYVECLRATKGSRSPGAATY